MADTEKYVALKGLNYPPGKRAEPDDILTDLPKGSVKWLLADGDIRKATAKDIKRSEQ